MICQAINSTGMKQYLKCASVFACTPRPLGVPARLFLHICRSTHSLACSFESSDGRLAQGDRCLCSGLLALGDSVACLVHVLAVLDIVGMRAQIWGFENSNAKASQSEAKAAAHQASAKKKGLVVLSNSC
jgi:hypothetical protein